MRGRSRHLDGTGLTSLLFHQSQRSLIRSVEYGVVTIGSGASSATATITSVDTANSVIIWLGFTHDQSTGTPRERWSRVTLTNATTVTGTRNTSGTNVAIIGFVVVQFWPGVIRQQQRGTLSIADTTTSGSYTISPALQSTAKSLALPLGWTTDATSEDDDSQIARLTLTNTTTVTGTRAGSQDVVVMGVQVVEFY